MQQGHCLCLSLSGDQPKQIFLFYSIMLDDAQAGWTVFHRTLCKTSSKEMLFSTCYNNLKYGHLLDHMVTPSIVFATQQRRKSAASLGADNLSSCLHTHCVRIIPGALFSRDRGGFEDALIPPKPFNVLL